MPRKSVEARLQSLQEKRDELAAEIKKVQTEKARELRKRQQRREALLGKVIYQLVEQGSPFKAGPWSVEDIASLVEPHLMRRRDRQLFGLQSSDGQVSDNQPALSSSAISDQAVSKPKAVPIARVTSSPSVEDPSNKADKRFTKSLTGLAGALPAGGSQDDLMGEFNL